MLNSHILQIFENLRYFHLHEHRKFLNIFKQLYLLDAQIYYLDLLDQVQIYMN